MRQDFTALLPQLAGSVANLNPGLGSAEKLELDWPAAWVVLNGLKKEETFPALAAGERGGTCVMGAGAFPWFLEHNLFPASRSRQVRLTQLQSWIFQFRDFLSAGKIESKTRALI